MVKNLIVRKLLLFAVLLVSACSTPHKYIPTNNTHIYHSNRVYYVVKRGDTIHSIAKKFHLSQNAILSSNNSIKASTLKPGNKISLPITLTNTDSRIPIKGEIIFGNKGIDIKPNHSIIVFPFKKGKIKFAQQIKGYGYTIIIQHSKALSSIYSNLSDCYVKEGMLVDTTTAIGKLGKNMRQNNVMLHFEIRKKGKPVNPFVFIK